MVSINPECKWCADGVVYQANKFELPNFNNYPFLTYIYITYIILTEIIIL
jgi:hypothetical protein